MKRNVIMSMLFLAMAVGNVEAMRQHPRTVQQNEARDKRAARRAADDEKRCARQARARRLELFRAARERAQVVPPVVPAVVAQGAGAAAQGDAKRMALGDDRGDGETKEEKSEYSEDEGQLIDEINKTDAGDLKALSVLLFQAVRSHYFFACKAIMNRVSESQVFELLKMRDANQSTVLKVMVSFRPSVEILEVITKAITAEEFFELVKMQNWCGNTIFHTLIDIKKINIFKSIIGKISEKQLIDLLKVQDHEGDTALHYFLEYQYKSSTEINDFIGSLLALPGLDFTIQGRGGETIHALNPKLFDQCAAKANKIITARNNRLCVDLGLVPELGSMPPGLVPLIASYAAQKLIPPILTSLYSVSNLNAMPEPITFLIASYYGFAEPLIENEEPIVQDDTAETKAPKQPVAQVQSEIVGLDVDEDKAQSVAEAPTVTVQGAGAAAAAVQAPGAVAPVVHPLALQDGNQDYQQVPTVPGGFAAQYAALQAQQAAQAGQGGDDKSAEMAEGDE